MEVHQCESSSAAAAPPRGFWPLTPTPLAPHHHPCPHSSPHEKYFNGKTLSKWNIIQIQHCPSQTLASEANLKIKIIFSVIGIFIIKIRRSSDRLIFMMGILMLEKFLMLKFFLVNMTPSVSSNSIQIFTYVRWFPYPHESHQSCPLSWDKPQ